MQDDAHRKRSAEDFPVDEIIWGAEAIGAEVNLTPRKTFYLLSTGRLPGRKIGSKWSISRRALRRLWNSEEGNA